MVETKVCRLDSSALVQEPVAAFCKYGIEFSGFVKVLEFLEQLCNDQLLNKESAPCI